MSDFQYQVVVPFLALAALLCTAEWGIGAGVIPVAAAIILARAHGRSLMMDEMQKDEEEI